MVSCDSSDAHAPTVVADSACRESGRYHGLPLSMQTSLPTQLGRLTDCCTGGMYAALATLI